MATKKTQTKKSPATTAKKSAKGSAPSKADFIRSLPADTPASEVVAKAKAAGIEVTAAYVYVLRSNAKIKAAEKTKAGSAVKTRKGRGASKVKVGGGSSSGAEATLRRAVAELGLSKAREIFAAVEETFRGYSKDQLL